MPSAAPSTSPGRPLGAFLAVARTEVARYGDDDDIFVRELVQNARDAGATAVRFKSRSEGDHDVIVIDDDGHGMSRATVERALLRLFSSEKDHSVAAGCFGVGFWSVLRFADHSIVVDTHDGNVGTALVIDLEREELRELSSSRRRPGTTITLRRGRGAPLDVAGAVLRHAAFVTGIKGPPPRLVVDDGVTTAVLNRPLALDDDVLVKRAIAGDGFRGIVGLSQRPRVEFLHHGLRVVEASSLASIVPSQKRARRAGLGLSARVDIDGLSVLIDRKTVVEDARVRAVVRACEGAAHALEREALDDAAPLPLLAHAWRMLAALPWRAALVAAVTLALGAGIGVVGLWLVRPELRPTSGGSLVREVSVPALLPTAPPVARALSSARAGFTSPRIDVRGSSGGWDVDVRGVGTGLLRLFVLSEPDASTGLRAGPGRGRAPTRSEPPGNGPLVALRVDAAGAVALPVLTSARVVRVVDSRQPTKPLPLFVDADGLPVVDVDGPAVLHVEQERLPAQGQTPRRRDRARGADPALAPLLAGVDDLDDDAAVDAIVAAVQGRVAYAADADAASAFDDDDRPFLPKTLAHGRGDCDVINTVLVRALLAAGFDARLAVGLVVVDDAVADDLHAWAELRTARGYVTLDASPPEARPRPSATPARAKPTPQQAKARPAPAPPTTTGLATTTTVGLGLLAVVGAALAFVVLRARAARRGAVVPLDVLPLFVAGLTSGAGERLGLRRRPFLPSLAHGPLAIDDVVALAHRGRVVRGTAAPAWLHRSVRVLVADDPRVRALLPHLPALLDVDAFDFDDDAAIDVDADLAAVRAVVDARLRGVLLVRADVDAVDEAFVRTARGHSHVVRVPRALAGDALRGHLVAAATTLREVRAALTRRPR